jgi:hypothetical protein
LTLTVSRILAAGDPFAGGECRRSGLALYHRLMTLSVVWTFWIAVALVVPAIALVVATIIGYVVKVSKPRYPSS